MCVAFEAFVPRLVPLNRTLPLVMVRLANVRLVAAVVALVVLSRLTTLVEPLLTVSAPTISDVPPEWPIRVNVPPDRLTAVASPRRLANLAGPAVLSIVNVLEAGTVSAVTNGKPPLP